MLLTLFGIIWIMIWLVTLWRLNPAVLLGHQTQAPGVSRNLHLKPTVSVIIAARNEEGQIARTLESLKHQTYANMEVIVVNDRSVDETRAVIEKVRQDWPSMQAYHVESLPSGWLGKNHALYKGTCLAQGEWFLFTDADIYFYPDAIERAIECVTRQGAQHMTVSPGMVHKNFWLEALVSLFAFNLMIVFRPHLTSMRGMRTFVGVGAFNMIHREAYDRIGTHAGFRMRPDDDLFLGKQVKRHGFRQCFPAMQRFIEVEWYPSVRAMTQGLEKNALTPFDFSVFRMTTAVLGAFLFYEGPFLGLLLGNLVNRTEFLLATALMYTAYLSVRAFVPVKTRYFLAFPVVIVVFLYILVRALWLFLRRGGINWRGTFYTKEELLQMGKEDH